MDWGSIIKRHGPDLHRIAYRITGSAVDADDVVQDVLIEALKAHSSKTVKNLPGWLRRRTTFRSIDARRKRKHRHCELSDVADRFGGQPEDLLQQNELAEMVRDLVATLPDGQATVFALHYFERMSHSEIAVALDLEKGAVAVALHKIRAKVEMLIRCPES